MLSAWKGNLEIAKMLLEKDAHLSTRDLNGNTALILAVTYGKYDMVELLLKANDNPNQVNRRGWPVIDLAIQYGHMDIANLLLAYGAKRANILGRGQVTVPQRQ